MLSDIRGINCEEEKNLTEMKLAGSDIFVWEKTSVVHGVLKVSEYTCISNIFDQTEIRILCIVNNMHERKSRCV